MLRLVLPLLLLLLPYAVSVTWGYDEKTVAVLSAMQRKAGIVDGGTPTATQEDNIVAANGHPTTRCATENSLKKRPEKVQGGVVRRWPRVQP